MSKPIVRLPNRLLLNVPPNRLPPNALPNRLLLLNVSLNRLLLNVPPNRPLPNALPNRLPLNVLQNRLPPSVLLSRPLLNSRAWLIRNRPASLRNCFERGQGRGDARSKNQQAQPGGGRFWVMPGAASLAEALSTALWSGTTPGQDQRLDDGTTDIDSLDAFEYTIERERNRLLNL